MAREQLRILIIDDNAIRASIIEAGLRDAGYLKVHTTQSMEGVARQIEDMRPDVIFVDLESPNRDMLENVFQLTRSVSKPIAMFVDQSDRETMEAAIDAGVSAYVVDGLRKDRVLPILDMAISRFNAYSRLRRELDEARNELATRKIVERAKGLLMRSRNIGEDEAYRLLRDTAMNQNRKIADVAESLVMASGLLENGKGGSP